MGNLVDFDSEDINRLGWIYGDYSHTYSKSTTPYYYRTFYVYMKKENRKIWSYDEDPIDYIFPYQYFGNLTNDKLMFIILWCHQNGHYGYYDYESFSKFHSMMSIVRYAVDRMDIMSIDAPTMKLIKELYISLCEDIEGYEVIKNYLLKSENFRLVVNQT